MGDLGCNGNEQRLLDCTARPIGSYYCGHNEDAGVVCSGTFIYSNVQLYRTPRTPDTCVAGNVRLIGGLVPIEGTVQMCVGGRWRELCFFGWGYQEAFVVCRQLGLPATGEWVIITHYM